MKKTLILVITFVLIGSLVIKNSSSVRARVEGVRELPRASASEKLASSAAPQTVPASANSVAPLSQVAMVEKVLAEAPNREEMERIYSAYRPSELRQDLQVSQNLVAQQHLLEKANAQQLSAIELRTLATELRRQNAIRYLLLSRQVARLKEKYR
jgi:hypothetical protein